jgi:hypothetical protein
MFRIFRCLSGASVSSLCFEISVSLPCTSVFYVRGFRCHHAIRRGRSSAICRRQRSAMFCDPRTGRSAYPGGTPAAYFWLVGFFTIFLRGLSLPWAGLWSGCASFSRKWANDRLVMFLTACAVLGCYGEGARGSSRIGTHWPRAGPGARPHHPTSAGTTRSGPFGLLANANLRWPAASSEALRLLEFFDLPILAFKLWPWFAIMVRGVGCSTARAQWAGQESNDARRFLCYCSTSL